MRLHSHRAASDPAGRSVNVSDPFSPGLFSELDSQPQLGIKNYGVSMTTLEDVFLRLESEAEVDQAGQ